MQPPVNFHIEPVDSVGFDAFICYLDDHVSDNGKGNTAYFQPVSRAESHFSPDKANTFQAGLQLSVGEPGWRRAWVALAANGQIIGHADLRSHPVRFTEHRCLLGMGVHRDHRNIGLGKQLIEHVENWARASATIEWIDLQVLTANEPALRLYRRAGFGAVGEIAEMFKIDGQMLSYMTMTKRL